MFRGKSDGKVIRVCAAWLTGSLAAAAAPAPLHSCAGSWWLLSTSATANGTLQGTLQSSALATPSHRVCFEPVPYA